MRQPGLYVAGQWKLELNVWRFVAWILNAIAHALLVFFLPLPVLGVTSFGPRCQSFATATDRLCVCLWRQIWASNGRTDGIYVFGTTVYSCLLLLMMYKVGLETRYVPHVCVRDTLWRKLMLMTLLVCT